MDSLVDYQGDVRTCRPGPAFQPDSVKTLAQWQTLTGNDAGSTISADMDLKRVLAQAESYLQM